MQFEVFECCDEHFARIFCFGKNLNGFDKVKLRELFHFLLEIDVIFVVVHLELNILVS
jgi:hypothetical protein